MNFRHLLAGALALGLSSTHVYAQSAPGWLNHYTPSATEWNAAFASKQDYSLNPVFSGVTLTGCTGPMMGNGASPVSCDTAAYITPQMFGNASTCNGVVDDTTAMQAAMADPRPLYIPALKSCRINAEATWYGSGTKIIYGSGEASQIILTNATADGIKKNGPGNLIVRDLQFSTTVAKTNGAAVRLTGITAGIKDVVDNCIFLGTATNSFFYHVFIDNDVIPDIARNYFLTATSAAVYISNLTVGGGSESNIHHNTFNTSLTGNAAAAIRYASGLNTLLINSNRIQDYDYGVLVIPADGAVAGLSANDNTFEANGVASISLNRPASGTGIITALVAVGNIFNYDNAAIISNGVTGTGYIGSIVANDNVVFHSAVTAPFQFNAGLSLIWGGNNITVGTANTPPIQTAATYPQAIMTTPNVFTNTSMAYAQWNGNTGVSATLAGPASATATAGGGAAMCATVLTFIQVTTPTGAIGKVPVCGN